MCLLSIQENKMILSGQKNQERCGSLSERNHIRYAVTLCPGFPLEASLGGSMPSRVTPVYRQGRGLAGGKGEGGLQSP